MERILLVDDDVELCELINEYLTPEGFAVEMRHDGAQGLEAAQHGAYDLLVLDVMLPKMGGFEVLRQLRAGEGARLPVLMLTARGEEVDRIVGLELGADDYLPKPFNPRELSARIRAILRRTQIASAQGASAQGISAQGVSATEGAPKDAGAQGNANQGNANNDAPIPVLHVGDIEMDLGARRTLRRGERLELTGVEFDLLAMLLRFAGTVVPRDELTRQILGRKALRYDRSIDTHVSNLRKKLGPAPDDSERITAIRSVGYIYRRPSE